MKHIASLLLAFFLFLCPLALAEESGFPGVWIENDGFGTLVILADGTARMDYYDGTRTIHYVGNALPCVPTENGIDMDYFGIIYHMVPAE